MADGYHWTYADRAMSCAEVAKALGTSKQNVHRIEQRALAKLRVALDRVENDATKPMRAGCIPAAKR